MKIILKGSPLSTQHLYKYTCAKGFPHMYMSKEGTARKEQYQWEAKSQWKGDIIYKSVEINVKLYFKDKTKRDIDNFNKILFDSLTGIVWFDDTQVKKMTIEKDYDKKDPRIEIEII